jgi:archaeosine-15-forming tRNA-guanine transglycosylase
MKRISKLCGALGLMLMLDAAVLAEETKGTVKSVNPNRNEVVLKGLVSNTVYELKKDANVWIDGVRSKLTDVRADDSAIVVHEKVGEHFMASQVRVLRNAKETTGSVKEVFGDKKEITVKGAVKNTTYELNKGGTVFLENKLASVTDIRAGDEVMITYEERGDHYMANDITVLRRAK